MESFMTENFWLVQLTIFTMFVLVCTTQMVYQKSYKCLLSFLFSYFAISSLLLPEKQFCMDKTNLDGTLTNICFAHKRNNMLYGLFFVCYYLQKLVIRDPQGDYEKFNFKLNNPFIDRQVRQKNLFVYLFLTIPLIPLSYVISHGIHSFVQSEFMSSGLNTRSLFKIVRLYKFDISKYITYFTQVKETVPLNFVTVLRNPQALFYWFSTAFLNFPGIYVIICDISSIFTLYPISLITTAQKVMFKKGNKKLYFDGKDYYYLAPEIAEKKELTELTLQELKYLADTSTFSIQRGVNRILNKE